MYLAAANAALGCDGLQVYEHNEGTLCSLVFLVGGDMGIARLMALGSDAETRSVQRLPVRVKGLAVRLDVLSRRLGLHSMSAACCQSLTSATMTEYMPPAGSLCASPRQESQGTPPVCAL